MNNQGDVINSGTFNSDSVNIIYVDDSNSVNKKKAARLEYELNKQWSNRIENINHPLFNSESGHSSEPDLTIEKTIWKSDDDMMSIVEYEHYGIVDNFESESSDPSDLIDFKLSTISSAIEASNEVDRIEKSLSPCLTKDDSLKKMSFRIPLVFDVTSNDLLASITDVAGYILLIGLTSASFATTDITRVLFANDL